MDLSKDYNHLPPDDRETPVVYFYDGRVEERTPANGKFFTFEELKEIVHIEGIGSMVEILDLPSGNLIIVNEEGKLVDEQFLKVNNKATSLWKKEYPISKYPHNNDELIVGNALVCDPSFLESEEE